MSNNATNLEFPILVSPDGDRWVAQSLLTCTTAVEDTPEAAARAVMELLCGEIADAIEAGDGILSLDALWCPASEEAWRMFHTSARALPRAHRPDSYPVPDTAFRKRIDRPVEFLPREAIQAFG